MYLIIFGYSKVLCFEMMRIEDNNSEKWDGIAIEISKTLKIKL